MLPGKQLKNEVLGAAGGGVKVTGMRLIGCRQMWLEVGKMEEERYGGWRWMEMEADRDEGGWR